MANRKKTVLIVNDEWGTAKGGISAVHRHISGLAVQAGHDVYVTALKADEKDRKDAQERGIKKIITPEVSPYFPDKPPDDTWLIYHQSYFPHLKTEIPKLDFIIGHAPVSHIAALLMKKEVFKQAKSFLFNHVIPEDTEIYSDDATPDRVQQKETQLFEMGEKFDIICSVGPRTKGHFSNKYRALEFPNEQHIEFIPRPDKKFFDIQMKEAPKDFKGCVFRVITVGRVKDVKKLKGYDLVAQAMSKVAESFHSMFQRPPKLVIRGVPRDESEETKEFFTRHNKSPYLDVVMYPYGTQDDIRIDFQQSHLCIMASRSEPFGMIGLEAMATGIPTLVTTNSGLAEFINTDDSLSLYAESVVVDVGCNPSANRRDIHQWEEAIKKVLCNYSVAFKRAQAIKKILLESEAIDTSTASFLSVLT
ncbi:uncharacterized protein [Ptychodera flava]|uniref:uncharacterized protein n=1 Tax=Ptychodera flava TaxID=63121 RepID=UPI00396A0DE6